MSQGYSDLQVVHDDQPGLEYSPPAQGHDVGGQTFWILAGVIGIVVVAAAVGGGVGGSLGSKSTNTKNAASTSTAQIASTSSSSTPSSLSSSTSTIPLSTSTITGGSPEYTLLSDCPSSNNTFYTVNVGQEMSFRKICGAAYLNAINGGDVVNVRTLSLDDCIVECATYNFQNKTAIAAGNNNVCNSVCWRNTFTNDDFPGQCFGFTTQNSSSTFVVQNETICDSAAWIDQNI
ncbi:uncharacterized protein LY89DRAFT_710127 [Mollisia scopiformis]|uniref:Uncharacterized protein n=1 Tax=Mollisia scopiformis TaxID=149040 RepID=A0A194WUK4_MOLSC|nr:uncharacterized protein LY89DRAFT_710127 [Mollisia scopiformis]KUJ11646.1 hypothetical protein LY89DRAFT_710127 [Mollisia scopiformis]